MNRLIVAAVVAAVLSCAAVSQARAAASFQPALSAQVFDSSGELHVFWQGADGGISTATQSLVDGSWNGPATIPGSAGTVASAPAATVSRQDGEIDVFWEGRDGGIEESIYNRAGWSAAPKEIPHTAGTVASSVGAMTFRDSEEVDVYWRAADGTLDEIYEHPWTGSWSAVVKPSATLPSGAAISSGIAADLFDRETYVELYWLGSDGGIWSESYDSITAAWSKTATEVAPAGAATSAPAVAEAAGDTQQQVFFRDPTGQIGEVTYVSGDKDVWSEPAAVPGTAAALASSAPAAAYDEETLTTHLLWESAGGQIWDAANPGGHGWGAALGDVPMTAPPPAPTPIPIGHPVLTGTAPVTVSPSHRHGRLSVKVTARWAWAPQRTRLRWLHLTDLPRHASLALTCTGPHCPAHHFSARAGRASTLRRRLAGARFGAGDRLVLSIGMRGRRTERVLIRIRSGKRPAMKLL